MAGATEKRSFGLSAEEVTELATEFKKSKKMPIPYKVGAYHYSIAALLKLGANRWSPMLAVWRAFKIVSDAEWLKGWKGKEARDKETGKDAEARFLQNLIVLQRPDYGRRLLEVGTKVLRRKGVVIDLRHDGRGGLEVRLNTNSSKPMKAGRVPKVTPKATGKPRKPQDARKGRTKGKKATTEPELPQDRPEPPTE